MCARVCLMLPAGLKDYLHDVAAGVFRSQLRYCINTSNKKKCLWLNLISSLFFFSLFFYVLKSQREWLLKLDYLL